MKTVKYLTICSLLCCLFTGYATAQNAGIGISIRAEFQGTNDLAFVAEEGDVIEYIVTVEVSGSQFPITNGEPTLTLPDGTLIDLDDNLALATGASMEYPPYAYTIDSADLGNQPGAAINEVRALAAVQAISQTGVTEQEVTATTNFDTVVINPDFMVMKNCVNPEGTLIGQDAEFEITVMNTGDVALDFIIDDASAVPPLVGVAVGPIDAGQQYQTTISIPTTGECGLDRLVSNEVSVEAYYNGALVGSDSASADCPVLCPPSFIANKYCLTEPIVDEPNALFEIVIENDGYIPLTFEIDDPAAGLVDEPFGPINPGESDSLIVSVPVDCVNGVVSNTAVVQAFDDGQAVLDPMPIQAECPCAGLEGCTPGFWKNHPDCWGCYQEATLVEIFGNVWDSKFSEYKNDTLMDALRYKGGSGLKGKARNLLRHAAAALLNACAADVDYPLTVQQIIDEVNEALDSIDLNQGAIVGLQGELKDYNELGCPIDAHCNPKPDDGYVEPEPY